MWPNIFQQKYILLVFEIFIIWKTWKLQNDVVLGAFNNNQLSGEDGIIGLNEIEVRLPK